MKSASFIFALLGISFIIFLQAACTGNKEPMEELPWIPTDLASATKIINDRCPEWVDPESRLDSVLLLPEGLTFYYSLPNKLRSTFDPKAFKAYLIPVIIDNIQGNYNLTMHRDSSLTMFFTYLDGNGDFITEISVEPEMYQ